MRKFLLGPVLLLGLFLGGCNLPTLNLASQVNLNTEGGVLAGYGLAQSAILAYKQLPLCLTGQLPSATNICARRSIVVKLQKADLVMNVAVNNMVSFIKNNPTADPTSYIAVAKNALLAVQSIANTEAAVAASQ